MRTSNCMQPSTVYRFKGQDVYVCVCVCVLQSKKCSLVFFPQGLSETARMMKHSYDDMASPLGLLKVKWAEPIWNTAAKYRNIRRKR